ncbi:MAG: class I SAM-dependent methyltransferase, partial [Verrucomicrobiota bacterium]
MVTLSLHANTPDLMLDAFKEVAHNLREQFKDVNNMHIIEIGGDGRQCKILADLTGFASYTIIDLSENLSLAKKHLIGVPNVHFIESTKLFQVKSYDLVISNYAFSRFDYTEYLDCIISPTRNGYMTEALPIDELVRLLHSKNRKGKVKKERSNNLIITWKPNDASIVNKKKDSELKSETAISYSLSGGRLGDNLIAYFHAKWLAYKYNLPLLYISFPLADQFCLFEKDLPLDPNLKFQNFITTTSEADIKITPSSSLFIIPYFSENTEYKSELPIGGVLE